MHALFLFLRSRRIKKKEGARERKESMKKDPVFFFLFASFISFDPRAELIPMMLQTLED